jgi:cytochrome c
MKRASSLAIVVAVAAGLLPASGAAWAQDAGNGQKVFNRCRACHAIGPGAHNKVGPALSGIVGRKAAAAAGFNYSDALKAKAAGGLVWTEGNLQQYLDSPDTFVPNGVMAFAGVKNEAELKDLIAFLKTQK